MQGRRYIRVWDSRGTFALGSTCCGLEIEKIMSSTCSCCGLGRKGITLPNQSSFSFSALDLT
jgi:hypothetical protein